MAAAYACSMLSRLSIATGIDVAVAAVLVAGLESEIWTFPHASRPLLLAAVGLLTTVPLVWRRRAPVAVLAAAAAGSSALHFISPAFWNNSSFSDAAQMLALYSVGANTRGRSARLGAAVVVLVAVTAFIPDDSPVGLTTVGFGMLFLIGPWLVGVVMRRRRDNELLLAERAFQAERRRDQHAQAAVSAERSRIARELHDVVAHAISVIIVQARGGERMVDTDPDRAREAFGAIATTGEQAMVEMRRLLGLLRANDAGSALAPQPSLDRVGELVGQLRESGLPVDLAIEGDPRPLPPGVDVSAYRIVQEALTNVLRHAGPAAAKVLIRYEPQRVEIAVADDGPGNAALPGSGHGLVGIRERVTLIGGALEAGPGADGGFSVRAVLPTGDMA
jgi:signal transduction histidine kinase